MSTFKELPDILTVEELSLTLKISRRSAYQLLKNGEIKHKKIGRIYRIPKKAVFDYLNKN